MIFKLTLFNFLKTKGENDCYIFKMRFFYHIFFIIQTIISQEYKVDYDEKTLFKEMRKKEIKKFKLNNNI